MDFELQVKMFTEQLGDLLEQAKVQASLDFASERSNWEQTERSYVATISGLQNELEAAEHQTEVAEARYYDLREKLAGLV